MNEGYALFDKVVSVLEGANVYKKESGSAPFPSSDGEVNICSMTLDTPGIYLILTNTEAVLSQLYNNIDVTGLNILAGKRSRAMVWGGGSLVNWYLGEVADSATITLIGYYSDSFDPDPNRRTYSGEIVAIKLLGGGVLRNLITRPRKAVVA